MAALLWSRVKDHGLEYCEMETSPLIVLRGHVVTRLEGKALAVSYVVKCEDSDVTKSVNLSCRMDGKANDLSIHRTSDGQWYYNQTKMSQFLGCTDIDLEFTPSTNTIPIRRFHLMPGESKTLTAVWLRLPDLSCSLLTQKYTCIDTGIYLYESVQSGYQARIMVDSDTAVIDYQGEWVRISH